MGKVRRVRRLSQRRNSGQILIIAAFIMASLLVSAQIYIVDTGKTTIETDSGSLKDFILGLEVGSRHVVVGSLANITNGGAASVLAANLQRWSSMLSKQYPFGKNILNYTLRESFPYSSGIWMDWGTNGIGISSAYSSFAYKLSDRETEVDQSYIENITTTVTIESHYHTLSGDTKQVSVTVNLLNEGNSALASQIIIYYTGANSWQTPDASNHYEITDHGNGTYTASFIADVPTPTIEVSGHVTDLRQILVQANTTSVSI
jgi:hypothetical protein